MFDKFADKSKEAFGGIIDISAFRRIIQQELHCTKESYRPYRAIKKTVQGWPLASMRKRWRRPMSQPLTARNGKGLKIIDIGREEKCHLPLPIAWGLSLNKWERRSAMLEVISASGEEMATSATVTTKEEVDAVCNQDFRGRPSHAWSDDEAGFGGGGGGGVNSGIQLSLFSGRFILSGEVVNRYRFGARKTY